jgi:hypothetical protein
MKEENQDGGRPPEPSAQKKTRLMSDAECAKYGLKQMHPDDEENKPLELFRIYERILMYGQKNRSYTESPSVGGLKAEIEIKRLFNRKFRQLVLEISAPKARGEALAEPQHNSPVTNKLPTPGAGVDNAR